MKTLRVPLTLALLSAALLLGAYFWTTLTSFPISFLYGKVAGLSTFRNVTQIASLVAAACLFVAAAIIAVPTALQPASGLRKILYVLPAYLLLFALAGVVASLLGIGTVGAVIGAGPSAVTLSTLWLAVGGLLSAIAVVIAATSVKLNGSIQKAALRMMGLTGLASLVAAVAMIISVGIVSTSQPSVPSRPGGGGRPNAAATQSAIGSATQAVPAAVGTQAAPVTGGTRPGSGAPGGGEGGQEGRSGTGREPNTASIVQSFAICGVLMVIFAVIEMVSLMAGLRASRAVVSTDPGVQAEVAPPMTSRREVGRTFMIGVAISIAVFVLIQFVPVARANPAVQAAVAWDSLETQQLWTNTCADCHSNETRWPWYAYVAPGSWLLMSHVNSGRQDFNMSELNKMSASRKEELSNNVAERIRNGSMPPSDYLILHPEARLSDTEKQQLIQGLQTTITK